MQQEGHRFLSVSLFSLDDGVLNTFQMVVRVLRWQLPTDAQAVKLLTWTSRHRPSLRWLMSLWDASTSPGSGAKCLALPHAFTTDQQHKISHGFITYSVNTSGYPLPTGFARDASASRARELLLGLLIPYTYTLTRATYLRSLVDSYIPS